MKARESPGGITEPPNPNLGRAKYVSETVARCSTVDIYVCTPLTFSAKEAQG